MYIYILESVDSILEYTLNWKLLKFKKLLECINIVIQISIHEYFLYDFQEIYLCLRQLCIVLIK